jgi:hypothetical protein
VSHSLPGKASNAAAAPASDLEASSLLARFSRQSSTLSVSQIQPQVQPPTVRVLVLAWFQESDLHLFLAASVKSANSVRQADSFPHICSDVES